MKLTSYRSGEQVLVRKDAVLTVVGLPETTLETTSGRTIKDTCRSRIELSNDRMVLVAETADQVIALLQES
jgi:hypothetical protein